MKIEVEFWQLVGLLLSFLGFLFGVGKLFFGQLQKHLDKRLDAIDADAGQWQRIEREFLQFKADIPVHYVRREDYIRGQSVIEAKLDGLATKIENAQLRALAKQTPTERP